MSKSKSLIYLFYHLLIWVVLPSTAVGERVFAFDLESRSLYCIKKGEANFSEFQHFYNSGRNELVLQKEQSGHWPVIFSCIYVPDPNTSKESLHKVINDVSPLLGALSPPKIIFPFHYFW